MRLKRVVAVALVVLFAARAGGAEHLVSPADIQGALQKARDTRAEDLATLGAFLSRPEVGEAARRLGVNVEDVQARVARLSDGELREIAARADALTVDPVAGGAVKVVLITLGALIALLLLVVILLGVVICFDGCGY